MVIGNLATAVVAVAQTAPTGQGFNLNPSDLRFILQQIRIAEQHAATATPENPCGTLIGNGPDQIPSGNQAEELPFGLRTVDGTCNNLMPGQGRFGAADNAFPRSTGASFREAEVLPPAFGGGPGTTSYAQKRGNVGDSQPRVISNLIVDQSPSNPAAVAAAGDATPDGSDTLFIPNVATDVGLSAPFNSWFTLFGQFFDHGLDLTTKGGATVFVPLKDDDPLIPGPDGVLGDDPGTPQDESADDLPPHLRFMAVTRSTNLPGPDGIVGDNRATPEDESADDIQEATNTTTPFVDQNQTYTSHPSHQVFLRQYELNALGNPVSDGKMIDGAGGAIGNWAEVRAQARNLLGIDLVDRDVFNVPLLRTDPYGRFVRGPNGYPLMVRPGGVEVEGDPLANGGSGVPVPVDALRTGHAFLDDIAHHAVPGTFDHDFNPATPRLTQVADADTNSTADDFDPSTYDDEMLAAHFITGDGRGNENIGLTAVHTVFHSEHNRLVGHIKDVLTNEDPASLPNWQLTGGEWNGERLFQAARFVTEMEYQHLVFEEFIRKVQPMVNVFSSYDTNIDAAIRAEFAHTVYRFGHSMLTETVARTNPNGSTNDIALLDAFLNPIAFNNGGTETAAHAAGSIAQGMTRQVGNEIDEFVTSALRNRLLGLPLDLPAINMVRGRETGIPPLNQARREFYAASHDSQVAPYESWADFGFNLKHPESLTNFIAAYGTHESVTSANTLAGKRAAAAVLVAAETQDSIDFLNSQGAYASDANGVTTTGVDVIDFWVGGLAEKRMVFGGLLGSSFNYVFERQMEDLQDGDRLYYLGRTAGLNLLVQLEGNSFAELIMRNTDAEGLPADSFSRPDFIFNVANLGPVEGPVLDDPSTPYDESTLLIRMAGSRTLRFTGGEHVVFNGTSGADRIWSSEGDDTIRGNDGNDWVQGGDGVDNVIGGLGDDIINDSFGDDTLKGGDGDDALSSGAGFGADLNQGGRHNDFVVGGSDITETFGGPGNDIIYAGDSTDTVFGDDGDDWIEGGGQSDLLQGDNGAPFQDDPNTAGHDVIDGDGGGDDYDSEGGDDIMLAGPGIERNEGMLGFDWVTHKGDPQAGDSDMNFTGLLPPAIDTLRDRFDLVEALSGWNQDDILRGDDADVTTIAPDHELNAAGIARINGLQEVVGAGVTSFAEGNILLGGAGSDLIEGRGGNDIIDGDKWLNVQLQAPDPATSDPTDTKLVDSMTQLRADVFAGRIDPGLISIVRTIETAASDPAHIDTAAFSDVLANYDITNNADGSVTVIHVGGTAADGTDTVRNVERLAFTDQTIEVAPPGANNVATGTVIVSDTTPNVGDVLVATQAFSDLDGINLATVQFTFEAETSPGVFASVGTGDTFTVTNAQLGSSLRVLATFLDDNGNSETITSDATEPVVRVLTAPGAPTIGTATAGNASATVNWTAPADDGGSAITEYRIQVRRGTNLVRTVSGISGAVSSHVVTGLNNGRAYNFRVRAINAIGVGALSAQSNVVTPRAPAVPGAPIIGTAVAGTAGGAITATANWGAPANDGGSAITGYRVRALRMSAAGNVLATTVSAVQPATSRSLEMTLPVTGNYRFTVQAINAVGNSAQSGRSNLVAGR